jgi:hypothetical protein
LSLVEAQAVAKQVLAAVLVGIVSFRIRFLLLEQRIPSQSDLEAQGIYVLLAAMDRIQFLTHSHQLVAAVVLVLTQDHLVTLEAQAAEAAIQAEQVAQGIPQAQAHHRVIMVEMVVLVVQGLISLAVAAVELMLLAQMARLSVVMVDQALHLQLQDHR